MRVSDHFTLDELKCKGSGMFRVMPGFVDHLERLRVAHGRAFVVNSCCRSKEHNAKIGGHKRSLHVCDDSHHNHPGSIAIDISVAGWSVEDRNRLEELAWDQNWSVGVANTFIHVDRRSDIGLEQVKYYYS